MQAKHQTATWVKPPSFAVKLYNRKRGRTLSQSHEVSGRVVRSWLQGRDRFVEYGLNPNHCKSRWLGVGRLVVFQHAATTDAIAGCETYEDKIGHWKPFNRHILTLGIYRDPSTTLFGDMWNGFIRFFLKAFSKPPRYLPQLIDQDKTGGRDELRISHWSRSENPITAVRLLALVYALVILIDTQGRPSFFIFFLSRAMKRERIKESFQMPTFFWRANVGFRECIY